MNITKNGFQYKLRRELEDDAIEFINYIDFNILSFEDSYLESYLYSLIYKIFPDRLNDGRPGILNIKIIKDLTPNAFVFQNGTLVISTGLLSIINSEEELIAVLAHEVSHFALDHSIMSPLRKVFFCHKGTKTQRVTKKNCAGNKRFVNPGVLVI